MPNALADRIATRYGVESAWGTVPSVAAKGLYLLSDSLQPDYLTEESEAVTGDRQVPNIVRVGQGSSGAAEFEFSAEAMDDLLLGAMARNAWDTSGSGPDALLNGQDLVSFSVEKHFQDVGQFATYTGLRVDTFSLSFAPKSRLTGSVSFMGKAPAWSTATAFTGPAVAAVSNPLVVTSAGLSINVGGVPLNIATEFTVELQNELRLQDALGAIDPIGIGLGVFRASGTLSAYFPDRSLVDRIVGDQSFALSVSVEDSDSNEYTFRFPRVKLTTESGLGTGGRSQDVTPQFGWTAFRDPSTGATAIIERTLATP